MDKSYINKSQATTMQWKNSFGDGRKEDTSLQRTILNERDASTNTLMSLQKEGKRMKDQNFIQQIEMFQKKEENSKDRNGWQHLYWQGKSFQFSGQSRQKEHNFNNYEYRPILGSKGNSALKYIEEGNCHKPLEIEKIEQSRQNPFKLKQKRQRQQQAREGKTSSGKSSNFSNNGGSGNKREEKARENGKMMDQIEKDKDHPTKSEESGKEIQDPLFKLPSESNIRKPLDVSIEFRPPSIKRSKKRSQDSDDDNSNLYENRDKNKNRQSSYKVNQGYSMIALERILQASDLYKNYLKKLNKKKGSVFVPELELNERSSLPQSFFFKPERIVFNKIKEDLSNEYNYQGSHLIGKVNNDRTRLYFQDLKQEQIKNMSGLKCKEIIFKKELNMSKNIEYDHLNKRFFTFSNSEQKIFVFSQASQDFLCSFKTKNKVFEPQLYLNHISSRIFLFVIGGYTKIQKNIVQGSKFIEIFELRKWEVDLQSKIINLVIGRISPIIILNSEQNETKIVILGGNSIAALSEDKKLDYEYEKDINQSTNMTGVSISTHQIIELFDYDEPALTFNHSIKILNPFLLHDGCVIPLITRNVLLLPQCKHLIQMKMLNKEINLIEYKKYEHIPQMKEIQRKQLSLQFTKESIVIYRISEQGLFSIISPQDSKKDGYCLIY